MVLSCGDLFYDKNSYLSIYLLINLRINLPVNLLLAIFNYNTLRNRNNLDTLHGISSFLV